MSENQTDKRLKMIEVILTLGGFLGIIIALEQDMLPAQAKTAFSVLIVLFIIFAFFAYASVAIPLEKKAMKLFLGAFSAAFSGLLAVALTVPLAQGSSGIVVVSVPYVGSLGAIILYAAFVFVITYVIYFLMKKAVVLSFEKMTHAEAESPNHQK